MSCLNKAGEKKINEGSQVYLPKKEIEKSMYCIFIFRACILRTSPPKGGKILMPG